MMSASRVDASNIDYYRDKYFFANLHMPGVWMGKGAVLLGLEGAVTQQPYENLLLGFAPDGSKLIRNAGETDGWYGLDLPLGAPKSVSVQVPWFSDAEFQEFCEMHQDIARMIVRTMEERVAVLRRGKEGVERHRAGIAVGGFLQFDTRECDVHVHEHLVVMRPAFTGDGHSGAINQQEFFSAKMALGALYRAELASRLEHDWGMVPVRKDFGFEIQGVSEDVIRQSSKRRTQIEKSLADSGHSSAKASEIAALATRQAKEHVPLPQMMEEWRADLQEIGFGPEQAKSCLGHRITFVDSLETRQQAALDIALTRATEQKSHFTDLELIRYVAEEAQGRGLSAQHVLSTVDEALALSPQVCRLGNIDHRPVYTTKELLALEREFLDDALAAQLCTAHVIDKKYIQDWLDQIPQKELSAEQRNAITHITTKPGDVQVVVGLPGTGKTTMLQTAAAMYADSGKKVIGVALSGKAAVGLTAEAGIPSDTVARTLKTLREEREGRT